MTATFDSLFPTFLAKCADLRTLLLSVAYAFFIAGIIISAQRHSSHQAVIRLMVRIFVLTAVLVYLPQWGNDLQTLLQNSLLSGLGVDPSQVDAQYRQLLAVKISDNNASNPSWWDVLGQIKSVTTNLIITCLLWCLGCVAEFLLWWAYIFQKIILNLGYALSPLLIGFMAIPALKHTGTRYLLNLVGVLLWPLGWAIAAMVTQGILDFMTDQSFLTIDPTASLYTLQNTIGLAVCAFWIIFSTVAAPIIIQKVIASGALAGSELLSGGVSSFIQTAATTAGAAAVASATGKPLVTIGAAGLAALLSSHSTAAGMGSAGAVIIAGSGLPPRSARGRPGDDITGDKAVRELIAKSKPNYF